MENNKEVADKRLGSLLDQLQRFEKDGDKFHLDYEFFPDVECKWCYGRGYAGRSVNLDENTKEYNVKKYIICRCIQKKINKEIDEMKESIKDEEE